jgi:hypothetical protein
VLWLPPLPLAQGAVSSVKVPLGPVLVQSLMATQRVVCHSQPNLPARTPREDVRA